MEKLTTTNLGKKLANAREKCPGLPESIYHLADYVAENIGDHEITPEGFGMTMVCATDDINRGICGFGGNRHHQPIPEYLREHKDKVKADMPYILQVIDAITEPEFADAVRESCVMLGWKVPKKVAVNTDDLANFHPAVRAAVDWWSETLQHPTFDNGDPTMNAFMALFGGPGAMAKEFSEAEMRIFRIELAKSLQERIDIGAHWIDLGVDYNPCAILAEAGEKAGINNQFSWPCKTYMWFISRDGRFAEIRVKAGYGGKEEIIWSADAENVS